jgi:hypothetical protein
VFHLSLLEIVLLVVDLGAFRFLIIIEYIVLVDASVDMLRRRNSIYCSL